MEVDQSFIPEKCPISWSAAVPTHPFSTSLPNPGLNNGSQSVDIRVRRYLETLWLPNSLMPLVQLLQDLNSWLLECNSNPSFQDAFALVKGILRTNKDIRHQYRTVIPQLLAAPPQPKNDEEAFMWSAGLLEKRKDNWTLWLGRIHRRDYQIQILLRLFILSYGSLEPEPLIDETSQNRRKKSPKKKRKVERTISQELFEEELSRLLDGVNVLEENEPVILQPDAPDEGWMASYCDNIIGPLFRDRRPDLYDYCLLSLCPAKYHSPVSSPASSPVITSPFLPSIEEDRRTKSRSPSFSLEEELARETQERSKSASTGRELSRARSSSAFSFSGEEVVGSSGASRGGVAVSKSIFARQVDMSKSKKTSKPKEPVILVKEQNGAKPPAKRPFSRSATMPAPGKEVTLVAETPVASRIRSVSRELLDSPDTIGLVSDDEKDEIMEISAFGQSQGRVLVPETPMKQ